MKIDNLVNINREELELKNHNIWFGISLGNKFFTKENVEKYINWSLEHTKNSILIVIADDIHAINIEILDNKSKTRALKIARDKGGEKEKEIKEIAEKLPESFKNKISVIKWSDVEKMENKIKIYNTLKDEFENNNEFRDYVFSIVKENPKINELDPNIDQMIALSEYVLKELPLYINGLNYNGTNYLLQPYPAFGKINKLIEGIQEKTIFPNLSSRLDIKDKMAIIDLYIE